MDIDDLRNCYVTRNGRISPYGTIRILFREIPNSEDPDEGSMRYSDDLLKYGYPFFSAQIVDNYLIVTNQHRQVRIIYPENIWKVLGPDSEPVEVMEEGWLRPALPKKPVSEDYLWVVKDMRSTINVILTAERGGMTYRDNSPFYRVDPTLKGREFMLIRDSFNHENFRVIDVKTRLAVPAQVLYPLAKGKPVNTSIDFDWDTADI